MVLSLVLGLSSVTLMELYDLQVTGGNFYTSWANLFASSMADYDFMDLYMVGGLFTWHKNIQHGRHVRKKLDRCMTNVNWRLMFPHALVEVLAPHDSDHNPILLSSKKDHTTKAKFFRFQAAWMSHPDYDKLVENTWKASTGDVLSKLGKVQDKSLIFNKVVFGNIFRKKRLLEARIRGVHQQLDILPYSDMICLEKDLQRQYCYVVALEELLWYQKSQEKCEVWK